MRVNSFLKWLCKHSKRIHKFFRELEQERHIDSKLLKMQNQGFDI